MIRWLTNHKNPMEITASEVLAKIEKGDPIINATIKCDLNPTVLLLSKVNGNEKFLITSKIKMINCRFYGEVNFANTIFQEEVDFHNSRFKNGTYFNKSEFKNNANFHGTHFCENAQFNETKFNGVAEFSHARFYGPAYFSGKGEVPVEFDEVASFAYAQFDKLAFFSNVKFKKNVAFNWAQFRKEARFLFSEFGEDADFCESESNGKIVFISNSFKKLILKDSEYKKLEVPWVDIQGRLKYDGAAYQALVKNYNNLEWFDDADECYWQYRTTRRKEYLKGIKWAIDLIPWLFYGYGVRPKYPLILSLVVFTLSMMIFMYGFGLQEPVGSMINATYLSVIAFTSNPKTDPLTGWYELVGIIERVAGWLLMASFLVVLAKKILR